MRLLSDSRPRPGYFANLALVSQAVENGRVVPPDVVPTSRDACGCGNNRNLLAEIPRVGGRICDTSFPTNLSVADSSTAPVQLSGIRPCGHGACGGWWR